MATDRITNQEFKEIEVRIEQDKVQFPGEVGHKRAIRAREDRIALVAEVKRLHNQLVLVKLDLENVIDNNLQETLDQVKDTLADADAEEFYS